MDYSQLEQSPGVSSVWTVGSARGCWAERICYQAQNAWHNTRRGQGKVRAWCPVGIGTWGGERPHLEPLGLVHPLPHCSPPLPLSWSEVLFLLLPSTWGGGEISEKVCNKDRNKKFAGEVDVAISTSESKSTLQDQCPHPQRNLITNMYVFTRVSH